MREITHLSAITVSRRLYNVCKWPEITLQFFCQAFIPVTSRSSKNICRSYFTFENFFLKKESKQRLTTMSKVWSPWKKKYWRNTYVEGDSFVDVVCHLQVTSTANSKCWHGSYVKVHLPRAGVLTTSNIRIKYYTERSSSPWAQKEPITVSDSF